MHRAAAVEVIEVVDLATDCSGRASSTSTSLNMGSDSIHLTSLSDKSIYKSRSSLCTHALHHTDSKDPDTHVLHR